MAGRPTSQIASLLRASSVVIWKTVNLRFVGGESRFQTDPPGDALFHGQDAEKDVLWPKVHENECFTIEDVEFSKLC